MATKTTKTEVSLSVPPINLQNIEVVLVGDSPLLVHKWSEKAKKGMLDKQMKKAKQAKEARDPEQEYKDSLYLHPDGGFGFPAIGFKSAAVDACSHVSDITKVEARGAFHINGELVKIEGEPQMREDIGRIGMGVANLIFRGEFKKWKARVKIRYNANVLNAEQIVNLFNTAGFAIGVGEWRPQRDGSFGMFHVANNTEN